jgi:MFS family permease
MHDLTPLRMLTGIGSGVGLCVCPVYLSEIAPIKIKGNVGVLTQVAVVLGIMTTQMIGLRLATPTEWRMVLLFSAATGVFQLLVGILAVESPAYLASQGKREHGKEVAERLWAAPKQVGTWVEYAFQLFGVMVLSKLLRC